MSCSVPIHHHSCTNPSSPSESTTGHSSPVEPRKSSEEIPVKSEPGWMQSHVAHASASISCPPPHFLAPLVAGPEPSMPFFPGQMPLGSQPIAEVKLVMAPKPSIHPHLSQERSPNKHLGKGEPAQVFWVKSDQDSRASSQQSSESQQTSSNPTDHQNLLHAKNKDSDKEHALSCSSKSTEGTSPASSSAGSPQPGDPLTDDFRCKDCGKLFTQPHHLIRHARTHTGEQPFKCDMCGRTFSDESHRLRHLRTHIGVRKHRCEECGKEFFEQNHLVRHYKRHRGERPWRCTQCDKAFCEESGLKKHILTHSSERPFKCEYCGKGFYQRSEMLRHITSHTGNKMFKCEVCEKSFADRHGLNKHFRTHIKVSQTHRCQVLWSNFHPGQ